MSLQSRLETLTTRIATEFKSVRTAIAGKANVGLSMPTIYADSATTTPNRTTWIAANCPGYAGPVLWDLTEYIDHPGPTTAIAKDKRLRRVS